MLRRMGWARLLPASLLLAVLASTTVTVALASFGTRALPVAEHRRLANVSDAAIEISGQIGTAKADADAKVIRASISSRSATSASRCSAAGGPISLRCPGPVARARPPASRPPPWTGSPVTPS
jgi:hypothetical protein